MPDRSPRRLLAERLQASVIQAERQSVALGRILSAHTVLLLDTGDQSKKGYANHASGLYDWARNCERSCSGLVACMRDLQYMKQSREY
jgi:hypothetical protein